MCEECCKCVHRKKVCRDREKLYSKLVVPSNYRLMSVDRHRSDIVNDQPVNATREPDLTDIQSDDAPMYLGVES